MTDLSDRERSLRLKLKTDFEAYARACLKIRTKGGGLKPFILNAPQRYVHHRLEEQRRLNGKVRALVLKARQWGCSTYVEGRFYWRVTHERGIKAFILTHLQDATDNLFGMAERFHLNCPDLVKPHTGSSNAKELYFDKLDSGYRVATAGSKAVGRSDTIQLFHASESAHWPNASDHTAGVLQAVPDEHGTEIIAESTANGVGGVFYDMCMAAQAGDSEYELIFVPWYLHEDYRTEPPSDWAMPPGWAEYQAMHDLSSDRIYWAYCKNRDMAQAVSAPADEPCWLFLQEYPATVHEAFQAGGEQTLIRPHVVMQARKHVAEDQTNAPIVFGVDLARGGGDKTRIVDRRGRCAAHLVDETLDTDDEMEIAGTLSRLMDLHKPQMVFVDATAGAGCVDRLKERGYRNIRKVNFGSGARNGQAYANKRAEMWGEMAKWFNDEGGVDIPDDEIWDRELCTVSYKVDSLSRVQLEKKEDMKKRLGFSPDGGDALALTFAESVVKDKIARPLPAKANSRYSPTHWRRGKVA